MLSGLWCPGKLSPVHRNSAPPLEEPVRCCHRPLILAALWMVDGSVLTSPRSLLWLICRQGWVEDMRGQAGAPSSTICPVAAVHSVKWPHILHRQQVFLTIGLIWKDGKTGTGWAPLSVIYNLVLRQARLLGSELGIGIETRMVLLPGEGCSRKNDQAAPWSPNWSTWSSLSAFCLFYVYLFRKVEQVLFFFFF